MNLFEFIKARVAILDVVQEYVALKPAGTYWKGFSPFKSERTASFTVSPHRGIFYCFSTGTGGDVISFVAHMENCSQLEAAQQLIERYHLVLPDYLREHKEMVSVGTAKQYESVCTFFAEWCHTQLFTAQKAVAYLKTRAFQEHTIKQFCLGYCPTGGTQQLLADARNKGIIAQQLIDAHLLSEGNSGLYCPFEDRLIFPIFDLLGRTCGFGGRIYLPHDTRPKYYNSREHAFFNKKNLLYGLHSAKKQIQTLGNAYLVEGYIDCITMVQYGYPNCVATLGTACTPEHLALLARYAKRVFVMYDGDEAGQKAILRLATICWKVNLELLVITLPAEHDPASYLVANQNLTPLLTQPQSIFSFFINHLGKGYKTQSLNEKLTTIGQLLETIITLDDPLQRDILLQQAAHACDIDFSILKEECRQKMRATPTHLTTHLADQPTFRVQKEEIQAGSLEKKIFSVILNNVASLDRDEEVFLEEHFSDDLKRLYSLFRQCNSDFQAFFSQIGTGEQQFVSKLVLSTEEKTNHPIVAQLMSQFRKEKWKTAIKEAKEQLTWAQEHKDAQATKRALERLEKAKNLLLNKGIR